MIDLHCHILPGIDDGAKDLAEAVEMCRRAAALGCEAMVATPHQRRGAWWNCDRAALAALRRRLAAALGPVPRIWAGGEIRVDSEILPEISRLAAVEEGGHGVLPLAGSRYLLLEFDGGTTAQEAGDLLHELVVAGWRPILAHPEFVPWMAEDPAVVGYLVSLGAAVQVTAMSVTGDFGRRAQAETHRLLDAGLVHFVASDAHDLVRRPPGLRRAWDTIAARWGEATAERLTEVHPRAVLEDRPLPVPALAQPAPANPRPLAGRRWYGRRGWGRS
jgi:protein-tyrosine phosphatase